ncbi:MAG TPA: hypothetical protein VEJ43_06260 [Pseudolabrys sp.]|nr:hypothetical protein [Pseudolabrys sp.]
MFTIPYGIKSAALAVIAALVLTALPAPSYADTGTVRITITRAGFIFGVAGGSGVLRYKGKTYPLRIGGLSVGTFGAASADLVGRAYRLRGAQSIAGVYSAVSAGVAIAGGGRTARMQNSNGVILELRGRQVGFELSLDLSGMNISLR